MASRDDEPAEIYEGLRNQILGLEPRAAGLAPTDADPELFGAVMETGYARGVATLVALIDGTTSLYLSTGGGTIGAGEHPEIAEASRAFVRALAGALDELEDSEEDELPAPGRVVLRALGYAGPMLAEADEDDLGNDRHPLSPVFHAAHEVIGRMRLLEGG